MAAPAPASPAAAGEAAPVGAAVPVLALPMLPAVLPEALQLAPPGLAEGIGRLGAFRNSSTSSFVIPSARAPRSNSQLFLSEEELGTLADDAAQRRERGENCLSNEALVAPHAGRNYVA